MNGCWIVYSAAEPLFFPFPAWIRWRKIYDKRSLLFRFVCFCSTFFAGWCFFYAKIVFYLVFSLFPLFHSACVSNRYQSRCWTGAGIYRINSKRYVSYRSRGRAYVQRQELGQIQSKYYYSMDSAQCEHHWGWRKIERKSESKIE